ncbi:Period circadian protein 2 [Saguinus oedipus]|uniref:Period circadian protein 2 n=1 Tax=Saguinus oedipus TaxID=9490 RepID=A0ABQ9VFU7_SAGOE|nr:Period circadian protein 2 [Saguinus oedipus]
MVRAWERRSRLVTQAPPELLGASQERICTVLAEILFLITQNIQEVGRGGENAPTQTPVPKIRQEKARLSQIIMALRKHIVQGSSDTSHTSKYFGSIDSSENNHKAEMNTGLEESERFLKCVLQDPIWLLMADADSRVMMTYQLPSRNSEAVLKEDREKLKLLQKLQPRFTESQKQELREVHTWMQTGGLPAALDVASTSSRARVSAFAAGRLPRDTWSPASYSVRMTFLQQLRSQECVYCENKEKGNICIPYEEDIPSLGLSEVSDTKEDENGSSLNHKIEEQT